MSRKSAHRTSEWTSRKRPIEEDMAFQRRMWLFQRIGWLILALIVAAGFLGLFSSGVLSHTSANGSDGSFSVHYQKFFRSGAAASLRIEIAARPGAAAERDLVFSNALMNAMKFDTIRPTPVRAEAHPDGLHLRFAVPPEGGRIHISVRPEQPGSTSASVKLAGTDAEARFWFFTYP